MGEMAGRQYVGAPAAARTRLRARRWRWRRRRRRRNCARCLARALTAVTPRRKSAMLLVFVRERTPGPCECPLGLGYANAAVNGNGSLSGGGSRRSARPRLTLPRTRPEVGKCTYRALRNFFVSLFRVRQRYKFGFRPVANRSSRIGSVRWALSDYLQRHPSSLAPKPAPRPPRAAS